LTLHPRSTLSSIDHFPVKVLDVKPSYRSALVVWIKSTTHISDIQKIIRQAIKLPEKAISFYKLLHWLKRTALCLGFIELLDGVASIFERESVTMPQTLQPIAHDSSNMRPMNLGAGQP